MYPLPQTPLPCTSGLVPRSSSMFEPTIQATASLAPKRVATYPVDEEQSNTMSPGSSLPCGQGTLTVATGATCSTSQTNHTLLGQESPIGIQNNPPAQRIISAPVATVPNTPEHKVPKSANGEAVKNSRKQGTAPTSTAPDGRLCFWCKQPGHLKKDCQELPYCSKCKTQGHIPASVLPRDKTSDSPTKDVKVSTEDLTKDAKIAEKTGRRDRISPSSLTETTDVSTAQVITGPVIVQ